MLGFILACMVVVVMFIQSILHRNERRDLYNRLMSRDLTEYRKMEEKTSSPVTPTKEFRNPIRKQIEKNEQERKAKYLRGEID